MLNLKIIVVLLCIPLAGLAVYEAWAHQQHSRVVAIKTGGARLFTANEAQQIQQVKDR
jgi:hypothetical protein